MRCKRHDLSSAPDGRCALCRKEDARGSSLTTSATGSRILGVLAVLVLAGGIAYRIHAARAALPIVPLAPVSRTIRLGPGALVAPVGSTHSETENPAAQ